MVGRQGLDDSVWNRIARLKGARRAGAMDGTRNPEPTQPVGLLACMAARRG